MVEPRTLPSPAELKEQLDAERQGRPFLLFRDDKGAQHIVTLSHDRDSLSVGRHDECDVCLRWDARASRLHAMLTRSGGSWTVYDGGLSRNGTFLNNERVEGHRVLHDGDRLLVGATAIRFRDTGPKQRTTVIPGESPAGPHISAAEKKVLLALCAPYRHYSFAKPASNKEIAAQLVLSVDTVKSHLRSLFEKFELDNLAHYEKRVRLVQQAFRLGVVRVSDFDEIGHK
jgi:DNA-binding CsgD family transcriptional regulator